MCIRDRFIGGDGDDSINNSSNIRLVALAGPGNDTLTGGSADDILIGQAGNDTINGGAGNDILGGNDGDDTLIGDEGNDDLRGGIGIDNLSGGSGDDITYGDDLPFASRVGSFLGRALFSAVDGILSAATRLNPLNLFR